MASGWRVSCEGCHSPGSRGDGLVGTVVGKRPRASEPSPTLAPRSAADTPALVSWELGHRKWRWAGSGPSSGTCPHSPAPPPAAGLEAMSSEPTLPNWSLEGVL